MKKFAAATLICASVLFSGDVSAATLDVDAVKRIQAIMNRPIFSHSQFGLEVLSLESGQILYALNGNQFFVPGSTTKLVTEGTVLAALGPDFRFHTKIYRTGAIEGGVVKGDLVLVASGDPNLSGRIQADGTLAFTDTDHSYDIFHGNSAVPGDPLLVIKEFAQKIEAAGIKSVSGRILVDTSLFPQGQREGGSNTVLSPVVLNDNVVDVIISPGSAAGASAIMTVAPETSRFHFVNQIKTSAAGGQPNFAWASETRESDGSSTVTLTGDVPVGEAPKLHPYHVTDPDHFVEAALTDALAARGIKVAGQSGKPDWDALKKSYGPDTIVAEHVSPPLSEDVKVTLKVSQNLHAGMGPYIIGAYAGDDKKHVMDSGFVVMHKILESAGLDMTAASQNEGAGVGAEFTPDFTVHYLRFMSQQPYFKGFYAALPILGRDGSLAHNVPNVPAAGHVHAKTGTYIGEDRLNQTWLLEAKALAGYIDTPHQGLVAFALYANHVSKKGTEKGMAEVGDALGEISNVLYEFLAKEGQAAPAKKH